MDSKPLGALPESALKWIAGLGGTSVQVREARRLPGSTSSALYQVRLEGDADSRDAVIRLYDNERWLNQEPDVALHESEALVRSALGGLSSPELLGVDRDGQACGLPAVLMTLLPGEVILKPPNMQGWLAGLAGALAKVHAIPAGDFPWTHYSYTDIEALEPPDWTTRKESWAEAVRYIRNNRPEYAERFIHRDYHPGNVLWQGETVSGIVDWPNACRGPAGADVGHCRLNLAQLYGVETADAFLRAYMDAAGASFTYHPYWDLLSLFDGLADGPPQVYGGWADFGVTDLTDRIIAERLEQYQASLMQRLEGK
ncbi:aminoglycoside phosphotransferase (APT) family kinase protein [Paenibacillus forsythiae]|uniref:Aminoglycoside phosphotransferase (APT) family kinase protein n=1 Tax=Paenibacillus forsythiae TaxID=365616 RepID=A0ABU3H9X0_9BACL|nr:aminoglycoside phosphotransferase family protein [Paenibacillus forsythiae]MDT3427632.1 aminoglycoside phosphotransferase (APT) family kinase protein [Paenibacillus forsythiae]